MSDPRARVLVVDDNPAACNLLAKVLRGEGYETVTAHGGKQALAALEETIPDIVFSDIRMPEIDGYQVMEASLSAYPDTPVILMTGFGDVAGAMEAIRRGAHDYLAKPYQVGEVKAAAAKALRRRDHRRSAETQPKENKATRPTRFSSIVGRSGAMLEVYKLAARIAPTDVSVLIVGESGTGKELVARAIHTESLRRDGPFVAVNCAGLAEGILESELFGHERGAFTGAVAARKGLFEQARGGTLFLDELGTIGAKMQSQLLRVLQEGELRRVGGNSTIEVDARILAATNRDLTAAVEAGQFREDLYYRMAVVEVQLPPLRERPEDIPPLVEHFTTATAHGGDVAVAQEAMDILTSYTWPGNVRELENTISRALALCRGGVILPADLPPAIRQAAGNGGGSTSTIIADWPTLEELTRRYATLVLQDESGNKSRTAQRLGIDRKTLYRLLASPSDS